MGRFFCKESVMERILKGLLWSLVLPLSCSGLSEFPIIPQDWRIIFTKVGLLLVMVLLSVLLFVILKLKEEGGEIR